MTLSQGKIDLTYGSSQLARKLIGSLEEAGVDPHRLTTMDLIAFDELHVMGRQATLALGELAGLTDNMQVLDVGSGLGGPARTLAQQFGCQVTGVDLSAEFVQAADELSRCVGLASRVAFRHADALALPFGDHRFDAVFMIHLNMNIQDKDGLFKEALRVLKPGGRLALWEICTGDSGAMVFPVPWSDDEAFSYLVSMQEMADLLQAAGVEHLRYEDATEEAVAWVQARLASAQTPRPRRPRLDLDLIIKDFRLKRANISRNLTEKKIRILRALGIKPILR